MSTIPRPAASHTSGPADDGVALVLSMLFMLVLSAIGMVVIASSRAETVSSVNYRMMSQARYGAESGVQKAAHFLLYSYNLPPTNDDPVANFDMTVSPVRYLGKPVVLSSSPDIEPNYPLASAQAAFVSSAQGALPAGGTTVLYTASATLLSMRVVTPYGGTKTTVVQTWQLKARGFIQGVQAAEVVVSAVMERQAVPVHAYALFALYPGCAALDLSSSVVTDSYDSSQLTLVSGMPRTDPYGGHVGTNGNLKEAGAQTIVKGSLSTPRTGVGTCTSGGITAFSVKAGAEVSEGFIKLPQQLNWPLPDPPSPIPPTTEITIQGATTCASVPISSGACSLTYPIAGVGSVTLDPQGTAMTLGNVQVTTGATLSLRAGTYNINSLKLNGGATVRIASGPVILNVAGLGQQTPVDFDAGAISNKTFDPSQFRILYAGNGDLNFTGGSTTAALVYAPASHAHLGGNAHFYGSILAAFVAVEGGAQVHYDRRLNDLLGIGPPMLSRFTWKTF